jgi:carboxyl-terminal processing protease
VRSVIAWICLPLTLVFAAETPIGPATGATPETPVRPAETAQTPARPLPGALISADDLIVLERSLRNRPPVDASPDEATIARLASEILPRQHYLRQRLNDDLSSKFLDRYLDMLDNLHLHFLQSDLDEFERYRTRLDDLTKRGDTRPAREIFSRLVERVEQRVAHVAELLKTEKFTFTGDDRYNLDRRHAARPKDLAEAKEFWRQHLRYEILQEKLVARKPAAKPASASDGKNPPPTEASKLLDNGLTAGVLDTITRRYSRLIRSLRELDGADVFQYYLSSLTHVYDPHSDYLGKDSLENFAISMNLSLFGIGAVLQSEDGYCKVRELKPGPALRSKKIKPGDRIVAVAQADGDPVDVVDMKLRKVVELIRGPKGTRVRLTVLPGDASDPSQRVEVALVRDEIRMEDEEAKAKLIELTGEDRQPVRIGIIDLSSFYATFPIGSRNGRSRPKSTVIDVARLLEKLKREGVAGIILDLRHNGGGVLEEAVQLTGLFIKEGPVVQVRDSSGPSGRITEEKDTDPMVMYDGPLVVLTSRFSASASEIFAGALQDYGRALIVGDASTHGKGTVQSLVELQPWVEHWAPDSTNNAGALKVTIRKFYRVSGASTQLKGVTPDIVLPSVSNYAEVGEASLDDAMTWDTIRSADYERLNRVAPILPELRRRSETRISTDRDFAYVQEDIQLFQKYQADKTVSLNETTRLTEKRENEERIEARKRERKTRPEPTEKVYDITLKQVDLPGLPPPTTARAETPSTPAYPAASLEEVDAEGELNSETGSAVDVALKEARNILLDLTTLSKDQQLTATR